MADVLAAPVGQVTLKPPSERFLIQGGLLTTALTLSVLYYLAHIRSSFNPMGLYIDFVFPLGALLVGLAAGSGYGIGSYFTGVRIRRRLLITIVVLQIIAYVAAEYIAYLDVLGRLSEQMHRTLSPTAYRPMSFLRYFHYKTESFAFQHEHDSGSEAPMGHWGYLFVLLAAAGFVGGGILAPIFCAAVPYCEGCQMYMKTTKLGVIPASIPAIKASKQDAAYQQDQQAAVTTATQQCKLLSDAALAADPAAFLEVTSTAFAPSRATEKLPVRLRTELIRCPRCLRGWVRLTRVVGHDKKAVQTVLGKVEVDAAFTRAIRDPAAGASQPLSA